MQRIELPFPPPLSACFTNRVGKSKKTGKPFVARVTTKRYEDWQKAALKQVMAQRPQKFDCEVWIYVRLVAPDARARDAGNADKAIGDLLVKAGVIPDDSNRYVRCLTYEWCDHGVPCCVLIEPIAPKQPSLALESAA